MESTLYLNTKSFHCNKTNSHIKPQSTITWLVEIWRKFSGNCSCNITFLASSLSSLIRSISFSSCMCGSVQSRKQFICRQVSYHFHQARESKGPQLSHTILYRALLGQTVKNCKSEKYFRIKSLFLSALQSCSYLDHIYVQEHNLQPNLKSKISKWKERILSDRNTGLGFIYMLPEFVQKVRLGHHDLTPKQGSGISGHVVFKGTEECYYYLYHISKLMLGQCWVPCKKL